MTAPPETRCDITELIVSQCSHCTGRGEEIPDTPDPDHYGPWFTARRAGPCAGSCGRYIEPGDRIRSDGTSGYLCEGCGSS